MYDIETRIEEIQLTSRRLAEGLLLDAVEQRLTDRDIAEAARFYHGAVLRLERAQEWREKVKPVNSINNRVSGGTALIQIAP